MDLSVVIPAINEADNLSMILPQVHEVLRREGLAYEIVVIDGGSRDQTVARAAYHGALVFRQAEPGYGGALREGFRRARGAHVLTMDADYSHDPYFIVDLYRVRGRAPVIVASRYARGGRSDAGLLRAILSRFLNLVMRNALRLPLRDLSSGFRLYDRRVVEPAVIESRDFEALEEILIKVYGAGHAVHEIPFHYRSRRKGVSKARILRFGWRLLVSLARLWRLRNRDSWADYEDRAYDSRFWPRRWWHRARHRIVLELLGPPGRVLDIGCGSSRIVQTLPRAVGLDVNHAKLRFLLNRGCRAVRGAPAALPFADAWFDQVILRHFVEQPVLGEIRRVLRPGGALVVGAPDCARILSRALPRARTSYRTLRRLLEGNGFVFEKARYVAGTELSIRARIKG